MVQQAYNNLTKGRAMTPYRETLELARRADQGLKMTALLSGEKEVPLTRLQVKFTTGSKMHYLTHTDENGTFSTGSTSVPNFATIDAPDDYLPSHNVMSTENYVKVTSVNEYSVSHNTYTYTFTDADYEIAREWAEKQEKQ